MSLYKHALLLIATAILTVTANAQTTNTTDGTPKRCITMEVLQEKLKKNPGLQDVWRKEGEKKYQDYLLRSSNTAAARTTTGSSPFSTLGNETVIPVVVHIQMSDTTLVTDRDIYEQIERLNIDYAGLNADKTSLPAEFKARFGSSSIRFALARTDTAGKYTTGIERKKTTTLYTQNTYTNAKKASSGGVAAWNTAKYYNVWVVGFSDGILGVSTFPYDSDANDVQGTVVNYKAFGNNPAYVFAGYNMGRTLVHETGHFFYLYHIWGDDNGACSGSDFDIQSGYSLPSSCSDDTPNQGDQSAGVLGGYVTDNCATTTPGINYQNYMDYTYDVSYAMFTTAQVCRMQNALTLYRSALASSQTDLPPSGVIDAALTNFTPGARSGTNVPVVCSNATITARLRNLGSSILTSTTFTIQYDGVTANTVTWTGSLASGGDVEVNLGAVTASAGTHNITIYTSKPNNTTDVYTNNDTLTRVVYVNSSPVTAPYTQNFESTTFPPAGWYISNPDNSITWKLGTAAVSGTYSALVANSSNTAGAWDDLVTPPIDFSTDTDSSFLSFSVAYRARSAGSYDGLQVWVSTDCGNNFTAVYMKSPPNLSTVTGNSNSFTPTTSQWRRESIDLTSYMVKGQNMIIRFRNLSGQGANLYIDSINVSKVSVANVDAAIQNVYAEDFLCSSYSIHPAATLLNRGKNTLTSATIHYQLNDGTATSIAWTGSLSTSDTTYIALPELTAASTGQHKLTVWVTNPNGGTDEKTINDTLYKGISIFNIINAPVTEGFEGSFPPESWGVYNPDNKTTWQKVRKATSLTSSSDTAAAVMANFGYAYTNAKDELRTPVIKYGTVDSIFLTFDVAAAYNSTDGTPDTLEVLLTSDCGASYTSIYKKYGTDLQTVTNSTAGVSYSPAAAGAYRTDSINLTGTLPSSGSFQVVFRNISNGRNNTYIDNINIKTKVVLEALKEKGFLITPNPTINGTFVIQHYKTPTTLKAIGVYDMAGRLITSKTYTTGNAPAYLPMNIAGVPVGMYVVKLFYTDHSYSTKILKQ
ncbi:Por secretion system C-terminal sorting domain-containing protein [Filimonas lacunae]|uniref:Por secretion system C-terminal sorting domain-containing protein n=1 Tax=Filimonas lacunae TaxID=477680 RepID=A0A173MJR6_9BACT|nr:M43 family zinc metalloprotease [Filimonas lacunae]BAV07638.1 hypothetical protein FLA_3664 [Filimonas lacunae]SIT29721.1 Por secretion system C-terminal sorting domain-containing protein [Filimonas lacunae]